MHPMFFLFVGYKAYKSPGEKLPSRSQVGRNIYDYWEKGKAKILIC